MSNIEKYNDGVSTVIFKGERDR